MSLSSILQLVRGISAPDDDVAQNLFGFAAGLLDGRPIFPVPLALRSATWLSSAAVEQLLKDRIRQATARFGDQLRRQGAAEEEGLTVGLLKELEFAFRADPLHLDVVGNGSVVPALSLAHRTIPKSVETIWGCDVSLLLSVKVPGIAVERAELVQVKKSSTLAAVPAKGESWRIDVEQLKDVLARSQTAAYWLFCGSGDVLVVPAIFLHALAAGTFRGAQGSFTVGYGQVRSSSIPLEQHLVDLFLGLWVGTTSDETLRFARGQEQRTQPQTIVEIEVSFVPPPRDRQR